MSPDFRHRVLRGPAAVEAAAAQLDVALGTGARVVGRGAASALLAGGTERSFAEAVEEARALARAEAHVLGLAEGRADAAAELERLRIELATQHRTLEAERTMAVKRAVAALHQAAAQCEQARAVDVDRLLELALDAAAELAEALVGHDLAARANPTLDAVRRALATLPADGPVTVRLHPDDVAVIDGAAIEGPRSLQLIPDPNVRPGGCLAQSGATLVEVDVRAALARVREVLAG